MGWFNSDKKEKEENVSLPKLPELPKLPTLPSAPSPKTNNSSLPSFPSNSFGEKFSQNAIKEAISGKEKNNFGIDDDDELEEIQAHEPASEFPTENFRKSPRMIKAEPIFIRIDKFQESIKIFKEAKEKISEMEDMIKDIKKIKEEEESELNSWENQLETLKQEIKKVDENIFSKID